MTTAHHYRKGTTVKSTEHNTKTPPAATGLFALLCDLLRAAGIGMPKITPGAGASSARRLILAILAAAVGVLAFTAVPALAVEPAPEAPETTAVKSVTDTSAVLEGVLNPHSVAKAGWYFAYTTEAVCVPSMTTPLEKEETVKAKPEHVELKNLEPNREYTFCMVATDELGAQATPSTAELKFTTEPAPPEVTGESTALPVKATEATLEAQVNPNNESTTYRFEYSTSATGETLNAPVTTLASATVLEGFGDQTAGVATGPVLAQGTTYHYRVVATNSTGTTLGGVKQFKTAVAPETPEGLEGEPTGPTTATLKGVLSPTKAGEAGTYEFAYRQSAGECQRENPETHLLENEKVSPEPAGTSGVSTPEPEETKVTGLLPGAQYTFCLIAHNSIGETAISAPVTFTTLSAAPTVASESAATVEETAATLQAEIDPDGAATTYHFEYLPEAQFKANGETFAGVTTTPESAPIGPDGLDHTATARITSLQPGTTYHYRVVATSSLSPADGTPGPDNTLTTLTTPGSAPAQSCPNEQLRAEQPYGLELPDCRAYEMVSPVEKNGAGASQNEEENINEANESRASISGEAIMFQSRGSYANPAGAQIVSEFIARRGSGGWSTQSITPPSEDWRSPFVTEPYESMAFTPELSKGVTLTGAQLTNEAPAGYLEAYLADFINGSYQWVQTPPPVEEPYITEPASWVMGTSTDLSHVVFETIGEDGVNEHGLFEWVDDKSGAFLVGVTNNGEQFLATAGASAGAHLLESETWHAVSSDGSRVFFTRGYGESGGPVDVRVNAEQMQSALGGEGECTEPALACTVEVSLGTARYWGASAEGTYAFYTEGEKLFRFNLGRFEEGIENKPATKQPVAQVLEGAREDLAGEGLAHESAGVQGVVQISEDGAYVYFVADGDLAGDATAGQPNLYVSHEGGAPRFIATLAGEDGTDWGGVKSPDAAVTPDGARLAFMSHRELTGYDNHDVNTSEADDEVYLYNAETGGLVCASCNPSGARPIGASSLASWHGARYAEYRARDFAEDGTLFFDSSDAVVPHASDGLENVYEYEDGHAYAISNVAGGENSYYLDSSPSGNDVFIGTADQLLPEDRDHSVDVYDARVDGGFPAPPAVASCDNGDSCKAPASPQPAVFGAPSSATFSGTGNPAPPRPAVVKPKPKSSKCKKSFTKKHNKCVKTKKSKKAKRSAHNKRRAKR